MRARNGDVATWNRPRIVHMNVQQATQLGCRPPFSRPHVLPNVVSWSRNFPSQQPAQDHHRCTQARGNTAYSDPPHGKWALRRPPRNRHRSPSPTHRRQPNKYLPPLQQMYPPHRNTCNSMGTWGHNDTYNRQGREGWAVQQLPPLLNPRKHPEDHPPAPKAERIPLHQRQTPKPSYPPRPDNQRHMEE